MTVVRQLQAPSYRAAINYAIRTYGWPGPSKAWHVERLPEGGSGRCSITFQGLEYALEVNIVKHQPTKELSPWQ